MVYKLTSKQTLEYLESVGIQGEICHNWHNNKNTKKKNQQKHNIIGIIACCLSPDKSIVSISWYNNAVDFGDLPYR
jgi:hypothetical protein